jgi:hypothetical protein
MNLVNLKPEFTDSPYLTKPIQQLDAECLPLRDFDKDGYEHGLVLDHCMLLTRYAFAGEAREQLEELKKNRPIVNKLLSIKPKYGIDFSLDYVTHDVIMEVIHIEQDFTTLKEANEAKEQLEHIIDTTDWYQGVVDLQRKRHENAHPKRLTKF